MECTNCVTPSGAAATLFMAAVTSLSQLQCKIGDSSIYPPDTANPNPEYDFVVIGVGSTGCVVANRLSSVKGWSVLAIEAGGNPPFTSAVPALSNSLQNTDADWGFLSDGEGKYCLGMVNHKCRWAQGKTIGGSSALNRMIYFRGNKADYDKWVKEGNKGWGYKDLETAFEIAEGITAEAGETGHLELEPIGGYEPLLYSLFDAAREIGNQVDYQADKSARLGYYQVMAMISGGQRSSVAKGFLAPIKSRTNLHITKNTSVLRILFDSNKRAIGVECERNGRVFQIRVRKEIIISSGAFAAAQLLMNSGIGPKEHLTQLGIKVVANLPVGNNMQGHIQLPAVVASINRGVSEPQDSTKSSIRSVVDYLVDQIGPLSQIGYGKMVGFIDSTHANKSLPDIQMTFSYFNKGDTATLLTTLSTFGYGNEVITAYTNLLEEADLLVITPSIQHPESLGCVRLASKNPKDRPKITPNFFSNSNDENTLFGGIIEGLRLLKTCSLRISTRVEPRVLLPQCLPRGVRPGRISATGNIDDTPIMNKSYWSCVARMMAAPDYLPVGTCKMGPNSATSVVDPYLRVHSVDGLRVIDPAAMPHITTGDTTGSAVGFAINACQILKRAWGQ
ncbi:glucose dehydrogenase [FAD, quinone]-like [Ischnura elegans]|uniref:glucose dehydrogenase [FAD, quinone]-like n=1 Tax=Ischnura elegans TaxID=197161 RepID=UPI001ED8A240|nr:glucose dehydrogenase [FAD, quinone]-like [Ischnura elegans]